MTILLKDASSAVCYGFEVFYITGLGTFIGTIAALWLSGFLCDVEFDNGWPLIFYVYGRNFFDVYVRAKLLNVFTNHLRSANDGVHDRRHRFVGTCLRPIIIMCVDMAKFRRC